MEGNALMMEDARMREGENQTSLMNGAGGGLYTMEGKRGCGAMAGQCSRMNWGLEMQGFWKMIEYHEILKCRVLEND
jgi:hypothetical protein